MSKIDAYHQVLRALPDWDAYLLAESGLPGPRGNIELARAVAQEGTQALFEHYLTYDAQQAPTNSPYEFLAFCGVLGIGRLLADGEGDWLETLRNLAADPRWRIREAVAMALQDLGRVDMQALLGEMDGWAKGNWLEKRAAAAALCEPDLLGDGALVDRVFAILDTITASVAETEERNSDEFKALRKGMAYCWSVAVAAYPEIGVTRMEDWFESADRDVRWIMKENLKKKRLQKLSPDWAAKSLERLDQRQGK